MKAAQDAANAASDFSRAVLSVSHCSHAILLGTSYEQLFNFSYRFEDHHCHTVVFHLYHPKLSSGMRHWRTRVEQMRDMLLSCKQVLQLLRSWNVQREAGMS